MRYPADVRWLGLLIVVGCGRIAFDPPAVVDALDVLADVAPLACPSSYTESSSGCHRFSGQLTAAAAAAQTACEQDEGHLAVITSAEENELLTTLEGATSAWIGVVERAGTFVAITTDQPPTYTNWASGDPNGEGSCVRLLEASGGWDDEPCSNTARYLCEIDGDATLAPVPP